MLRVKRLSFEEKVALGYVTALPGGGYFCNICGKGGQHWYCACADIFAERRLDELQPEE